MRALKSTILFAVTFSIITSYAIFPAWGDDRLEPIGGADWYDDLYKDERGSVLRDYDNDGIPNFQDPYHDDLFGYQELQDYDDDGIPNYLDLYNDYRSLQSE